MARVANTGALASFRETINSRNINEATPQDYVDWGLSLTGVPELWRKSRGTGVSIAVIDSGISDRHPDLMGSVIGGQDFTGSQHGIADRLGHGTHIAGIIAARRNGFGVIGVAPECSLLIGKVFDGSDVVEETVVARAVEWATSTAAHIITMSIEFARPTPLLQTKIRQAIAAGKIVVCSAGNMGPRPNTITFPAAYDEVISVGAIDQFKNAMQNGSVGNQLKLVAPGVDVTSTWPLDRYNKLTGSSMAAPFVAGVSALVIAKHQIFGGSTPANNQSRMLEHLVRATIDLGAARFDPVFGWGLINPAAAVG